MSELGRLLGVLAATAIAVAGVTGCGGGTATDPVAEVNGNVITKSMFSHWLHLTAVRSYLLHPLTPVPAGVMPDPPRYTRCIAYLKTSGVVASPPGSSKGVPLKKQCEQRYQALRDQVLASLITCEWLISEGEARGLVASDKAVRQYAEMTWRHAYASKAEFEKSTAIVGETTADELFRAKVKVFSAEIEQQYGANIAAGIGLNNRAFVKFMNEFPKKWATKTSCHAGYVVANCKQYRGKIPPEALLP